MTAARPGGGYAVAVKRLRKKEHKATMNGWYFSMTLSLLKI